MSDRTSERTERTAGERSFIVRVLRQDNPDQDAYWELHRVAHVPDMNCISVLQAIAEEATDIEGRKVAPVVWECNCLEEVCGACTMIINGRVRQACTALVDQLLTDKPGEIELRPMTKFPVVRDLMVDRRRIFAALRKVKAWVPVDSYHHMGPGRRQSQETQQMAHLYSKCMSCGCCLEACPQFLKIDLRRKEGETEEEFRVREGEAIDRTFVGAHALAQVELYNSNPIGQMNATERLDALTSQGGIQACGNAQNCVKVCPKEIPLTTAIARAGRSATAHTLRKWFDR